jgi:hypothetical protein
MGFVEKLRNEVNMIRNITAFLEKVEEREQWKKQQIKINVSVQTSN